MKRELVEVLVGERLAPKGKETKVVSLRFLLLFGGESDSLPSCTIDVSRSHALLRRSNPKDKQKRACTSACAARAGRIRAACGDDVDGIIEEGEEDEGEESDATRAAEEGESRAARIRV